MCILLIHNALVVEKNNQLLTCHVFLDFGKVGCFYWYYWILVSGSYLYTHVLSPVSIVFRNLKSLFEHSSISSATSTRRAFCSCGSKLGINFVVVIHRPNFLFRLLPPKQVLIPASQVISRTVRRRFYKIIMNILLEKASIFERLCHIQIMVFDFRRSNDLVRTNKTTVSFK